MTIHEAYEQAQLSEAAYADFWHEGLGQVISTVDDVKKALIDSGFSPILAEEFVTHWRVVSHLPNTDSGFSATVFESIDNPGEPCRVGTPVPTRYKAKHLLAC